MKLLFKSASSSSAAALPRIAILLNNSNGFKKYPNFINASSFIASK
jgi:hypothetical protein